MSLLWKASSTLGVVPLRWTRRGPLSALYRNVPFHRPRGTQWDGLIDERIRRTAAMGEQPLWDGYEEGEGATRTPTTVGTERHIGRFYADLARRLRPQTVVEFGSAFGFSGMHWLAGLKAVGDGHLFSFEPNKVWAVQAEANMRTISDDVTLTVGTFEESVGSVLGDRPIDLAFIDAIHTSEFVEPQFELVASRLSPNGVIVLDDIAFSDDMRGCWQRLASQSRVSTVGTVTGRVGLLQLP